MTGSKRGGPLKYLFAVVLILLAAGTGWIAIRSAATQLMSDGASQAGALAWKPEALLDGAMREYMTKKGQVRARSLPDIRAAASRLPLDDRPYLLIGSTYLQRGDIRQATKALEAGRRLNPRRRPIHLALADRYLRDGNFVAATDELAVLTRLVDGTQPQIAGALAQMSVYPETHEAVRRTLRQDIALEQAVLTAMASKDIPPSDIFAMASPAAWATANLPGGWGVVLTDRLVNEQRYRLAREIWQRINHLPNGQVPPLLYNANLDVLPSKPPFNWSVSSNNIAAVDLRSNKLEINYYGRDTGELVSQFLLLPPGNYRFSHVVSGLQRGLGPTLSWSIACANRPDSDIAHMDVPATSATPRRVAVGLTVPDDCPAQRLRLIARPGEFPMQVSATIDRLQLERLNAK